MTKLSYSGMFVAISLTCLGDANEWPTRQWSSVYQLDAECGEQAGEHTLNGSSQGNLQKMKRFYVVVFCVVLWFGLDRVVAVASSKNTWRKEL